MEKYRKIAYLGASGLIILALCYVFLKYAIGILLPFLISFFIAFISRPLVDRICRNTKLNRSAVSVVIMFLLLFMISYLIFTAFSAAITQLGNLIGSVTEQLSGDDNYITDFLWFIDRYQKKDIEFKRE